MAATIEKLVKKISVEHKKTISFFKGLPDSVWNQRLYADGEEWTVHEVLAHIVEAEGSFFALFSNIAKGGSGVSMDFDIDRHNAAEVGKISGKTRAELFSLFNARRTRMISLVNGFSSDALNNIGNHPFFGEITLGEMIRLYILHINIHIRDIRKIAGKRGD
jgi:hypothetical protein